jgi:hypothetical protein
MAVPAEKLDMLLKDLLEKANKSQSELNIISLDEHKGLNSNKIPLLTTLKDFVTHFNKDKESFVNALALIELLYLLHIYSKLQPEFTLIKELEITNYLNSVQENNFKIYYLLNEVKNYPNEKRKATSLKLDNKTYLFFKYYKNRIEKIKEEIENYNFSNLSYLYSAIENLEHIVKKYFEYKDKLEAFLKILAYYYSDPEDLEWTDKDREYVRKHYASKER